MARVGIEEEEALLVLESETRWRGNVPERTFHYVSRLRERYKVAVYPVVLVFRPGGRLQSEWMMRAWGQDIVRFRLKVIPLWEVEAKEVIAQRLRGLYPLLPLMKWEGKEAEEVLEESQKLVLEEIQDREPRADAYVALRVLSGIRYPLEFIHRILRSAAVKCQEKSECKERFFSSCFCPEFPPKVGILLPWHHKVFFLSY